MKFIDAAYWGECYFKAKTRQQESLPLAMRSIDHKFRNRHHSTYGAWYRRSCRESITAVRAHLTRAEGQR